MNPITQPPQIPNPLAGSPDIGGILAQVINALLLFAGVVGVLFIIIGGFRYIISMGNSESIDKARQTVVYSILGMILIFLSYLIVQYLMNNLLGVSSAYRITG